MRDIGLVLAGGGGKGAYQIGVWRYLAENGVTEKICGVSGTSVGALNAALFAAGDLARAEDLWLNISPGQVLTPRRLSKRQFALILRRIWHYISESARDMPSILELAELMIGHIADKGYLFSQAGLGGLIERGLNFSALAAYPCPCFATCLDLGCLCPRSFDLRGFTAAEIKTLLLASSAIPAVFDEVSFRGQTYCDGGIPIFGDNVPVQPLYDIGVRRFIIVHLSQNSKLDPADFPQAELYQLVPRENLGETFNGTLDFSAAGAQRRMLQGYLDAAAAFNKQDWQ